MTPAAILDAVHARGVTLEPTERGTLKVRPGLGSLTPELLAEIRAAKLDLLRLLQAPDSIAEYRATLGALWSLGAQGAAADRAEIARLLAEQARQCDELGPEFSAAVSRHASREWATREQRCTFCGMEGVYHDPDSGEDLALEPRQRSD